MPFLDGFQVKKILNKNDITSSIPFVYLTASADIDSMRKGMQLGADDYVVKPIDAHEILKIIEKRLKRISSIKLPDTNKNNQNSEEEKRLSIDDKISLNVGKDYVFVPVKDIVFISVSGDYTKVYVNGEKKVLIKKTILSWEKILPEKTFVRVHRNKIINLNYVEKLEPFFNGSLIAKLKNYPDAIRFSKRYSRKIKKMLKSM
jgi:two-component system LytT family response regulator